MSSIKWIKLNVDMFDDEKIKIIQAMPEGDAILLIWIKLILLAGKTNEGGYIYIHENMPYTEEMLSIVINKPLQIIRLALDTFKSLQMIENDNKGIYLVNFEKHQSIDKLERIKEQTRLRVARYREKQKNNVTLQVTQSNAVDKEEDIDIEKEEINKEEKYELLQTYKVLTPSDYELLNGVIDNYSIEEIKEAIDISKSKNAKSIKYLLQVLKNPIKKVVIRPKWFGKDIKGVDLSLNEEEERELAEIIKGT